MRQHQKNENGERILVAQQEGKNEASSVQRKEESRAFVALFAYFVDDIQSGAISLEPGVLDEVMAFETFRSCLLQKGRMGIDYFLGEKDELAVPRKLIIEFVERKPEQVFQYLEEESPFFNKIVKKNWEYIVNNKAMRLPLFFGEDEKIKAHKKRTKGNNEGT